MKQDKFITYRSREVRGADGQPTGSPEAIECLPSWWERRERYSEREPGRLQLYEERERFGERTWETAAILKPIDVIT